MSKDKNKLIPELRFPEFVNDEEWEEKKLGECLLQNPEYGINAPAVPFSNNLPTYLRITDISEDGRFLSNAKVSVDRDVTENNYLSEGDIALARTGASVGKSYKYRNEDGRLVFAGFLIRIKPDSYKLNSDLLFQFLSTNQYWKWVSFISARSGQPGINGTEYSSLPIILPSTLNEQQKIASCLSSLDEVIAAHSQKLDALKEHKKGLMQNLFPQEGETVPKYRFPEFVNDGEWEEKTLDEVGDFIGGGTPDTTVAEFWDGGIQWYTPTEVKERSLKRSVRTISEKGLRNSSAKLLPKGALLITTRATIGDVGIADYECSTNQGFQSLVVNKSEVNIFWYYWILQHKNELIRKASGSTFPEIGKNEINRISTLSPNHKEQQKIAFCLSALDELITAQTEKIEQLKFHKKGLTQGLFPKIND